MGLLLTVLLAQSPYYSPDEARAVFREANEAYSRGEYSAAEEGYRRLLEHGHGGADVLYNLGTAHLAQRELGAAVLYLERARREGASGPDVDANLAVARAQQLDKVVGEASDVPLLERLADATDARLVTLLFLGLWVSGFLLLVARRFVSNGQRLWVLAGAVVALVGAVPAAALMATHAWVRANVHEAVVLSATAQAREFPSTGGRVAFEVHEGLKVRVLESRDGYVRIRLRNGLEGWTEQDAVSTL
ncbi:MAG: SH3 domain-containing protein [Myxococcaceae bacterium]|nr:SH3 domain-containing protein [Myxococcaceae bacterium]MCI0668938.1 SH3 domain-containing protein [Myxococcaceae bacterium]